MININTLKYTALLHRYNTRPTATAYIIILFRWGRYCFYHANFKLMK